MDKRPVLAGDIGGTKTALALYNPDRTLLREATYINRQFSDILEVIGNFLAGEKHQPGRVCLGAAGPVRDNRVRMTNLDWVIDAEKICSCFPFDSVRLVNDLVATTAGVQHLPADGLLAINPKERKPQGTIAVLAAGTGLGQSFAVWHENRLYPFPSEGGHATFAPRNQQQIELLTFMLKSKKHVSVEQVCSGLAIPDLFTFISSACPPPDWLNRQLRHQPDQTPTLIRAAVNALTGGPACEAAVRTMFLFVDILAAEAANLTLKSLATGGVYIGGGIPPRILPFFDTTRFMSFFSRGSFSDLLAAIPVHIILASETALTGARELAMTER